MGHYPRHNNLGPLKDICAVKLDGDFGLDVQSSRFDVQFAKNAVKRVAHITARHQAASDRRHNDLAGLNTSRCAWLHAHIPCRKGTEFDSPHFLRTCSDIQLYSVHEKDGAEQWPVYRTQILRNISWILLCSPVVRLDKLSRSTKRARYEVSMSNGAFAKGGHRVLSKQVGSLAKHRFTYLVFKCTRELQSIRRCCHT